MAWASGDWRATISSVTTASIRTDLPHKPHPSPDQFVKKMPPGCERLPPQLVGNHSPIGGDQYPLEWGIRSGDGRPGERNRNHRPFPSDRRFRAGERWETAEPSVTTDRLSRSHRYSARGMANSAKLPLPTECHAARGPIVRWPIQPLRGGK